MSILRIGGIASGFDTNQMVKDLMRAERMRVDKLYQERQVLEWQRNQFRDITNSVRSFRDKYFNLLNPSTNMMSSAALQKMTADSSNTDVVTVSASADAMIGDTTFEVTQRATAATASQQGITVNHAGGDRLSLNDTMGTISTKLHAGNLDFVGGQFTLTINNTAIVINETDTWGDVLSNISNSEAGAQISYSTFSDTFTLTSRETGAGQITTDNGGNFFGALGIPVGVEPVGTVREIGTAGQDANFRINGFAGTRSTNSFTIDGLTYTIPPGVTAGTTTITTTADVDGVFNTIESFVNDYNTFIDEINSKLQEERFRDFPPLTDEQKEAMSETDIARWEEKAQSGLLRRESSLENMLQNMRTAIFDMVGTLHLTEIGIETSKNFQERGKLVLANDGETLRQAITANPDKVAELFTRSSSIAYSPDLTAAQRTQRYQESGLAHRLSDILNDNIRTTRDSSGRKGIFLERAGIGGSVTQFNNLFNRQIDNVNRRIDRMHEILYRREEQYHRQFLSMERTLQRLNAQGDWLTMQLNQGWGGN